MFAHFRCEGLILLETYTTMKGETLELPDFLEIVKEVTHDRNYSMFTLSRKNDEPEIKCATNSTYSYGVINGNVNAENGVNCNDLSKDALISNCTIDDTKEKTSASVM